MDFQCKAIVSIDYLMPIPISALKLDLMNILKSYENLEFFGNFLKF
jgi:hypothetical protein